MVDIQMRCYDSSNPVYRMLLNVTMYDAGLISVYPWSIPANGLNHAQPWISCVFSRITTDNMGNVLPPGPGTSKSMAIQCINLSGTNSLPILEYTVWPGGFKNNLTSP